MYQKYCYTFLLTCIISIASLFSQNWQPLSNLELNNQVRTMAVDGAANVYFGGSFTLAGSSPLDYLAKYDGNSWSDIGGGLPNSNGVQDIAVDQAGNVYVSNGYFETGCFCLIYYIHKWNGTNWTLIGEVSNAFVSQIEVDEQGHLYAMGDFSSISGVSANKIAYFNGTAWSPLGSGIGANGSMKIFSNGDLYVAKTTTAGGQNSSLAKWNGSAWTVLSTDAFNSTVWDLEEGAGGDLYAAGNFAFVGSLSANRIAKWNGTTWSALSTGLNGLCETILFDNGTLYAGGTFTQAGGAPASAVAQWNGTTWSAMGDGFSGSSPEVKDMVTGLSGNLVAGGSFSGSGSAAIMNAAKWATATLPDCTNLLHPVNGAINVASFTDLTWASAGASGATGYRLSVGTTPGGTNILNNYDAGNVVTYDLPANLPYATTIYVKITPYSIAGDAVGCMEESFTTISGSACLTGGVTFQTQAQINAFSTNYPGCTEILGHVTIDECCAGNITNLEGLSPLTGIDGGLFVFVNPTLPDLEGLENLVNLQGTLQILNSSLNSLSGIQNIQPAGITNLFISNNQNLSFCEVQSVCDYLGNPANTFTIYDNAPACENKDSIQIACTTVPDCTTLTNPVNGAINIAIVTNLAWNALSAATGYRLTIGTTSGGTDILNNIDVGNVTTYDPAVNFPHSTTIFVKITPYNSNGNAVGCVEESFGTESECPSGIITLTTQAEIDAFLINYPNCTQITGSLWIGDFTAPYNNSNISSLSGLSSLTSVSGDVLIWNNPNLTNVWGLQNLSSIGGQLQFYSNNSLSSMIGLHNLSTIGSTLDFYANPALANINSLTDLTSIGNNLNFYNNGALTSLSGLYNVSSIGGRLFISGNQSLTNIDALSHISSFNNNIWIVNNQSLSSLNGLINVTSIASYLHIQSNPSLTDLSGLNNLVSIGGYLDIAYNTNLISLSGLSNVTTIGGYLSVNNNAALHSLSGLENINPASITNLILQSNGILSYCEIPSICDYLANPNNPATISGNATGCASRIDVETACNVTPPPCSGLTIPSNGATNVPVTTSFSWNVVSSATGYLISIGTTPGGSNILNNYNVGNVTTFNPSGLLPYNKTLYLRITPFNGGGLATGCAEYTFTTSATGSAGFAYIANSGSDNVSVINTETNTVITSINVGDVPYGACVTPDGSKSFVANVEGNSISVINNLSLAVETTIPLSNAWPRVIAFSPSGNKAYVTTQTGYLTVIDVATNIVTNSFIIGSLPYAICSSPDGNKLYIGQTGGNIIIFNTQTNTIETTINVGIGTSHIAITPDGTRLFVGDQSASSVKIVSTLNNQVVATIPLGGNGLNSIVINTSGTKAYLSIGYTNDIRVINIADYQILNTIPLGVQTWGLSLSPDESRLYVASPGSNLVKVISTATNAVTNTITVGTGPVCYSHPFVTGQPYSPPNTCPPAGLTFTTQSQVDSFPILYPNCTIIDGDVQIVGNNIQSLAPLSQIETITGYLFIISNPMLVNLQGLQNLTTVGSNFIVNNNNLLTNLNGLNSLTNVGSLEISSNMALIDLQGLESLESAGAGINITDNILLTGLTGLDQLTYAENFYLLSNPSLVDISSMNGIDHTTLSDLWIYDNLDLSVCEVPTICAYLAIPNNAAWIEQNATGCATIEEVEAACTVTPTLLSLTSTAATIKYHNPIDPATATAANLKIWGDETGLRSGNYSVSNDTVTFQPITPFRAGEVIHITSKSSLLFTGGGATQPFSWMRPSAVSNPTAAVFDTTGTGIILPAAAYGANASYQATMADLNQDGLQDLIHRYISSGGASTNILVYLRNGNGTFAAPVTYNNSASYSILIGTPDLNNDGYPDIVLAHNVPSQIQVRLNNGAGGFGAAALYTVTNYCNGAKIYDLDNDGDLDIIAYAGNSSLSQNTISVLKNNGNGTFAAQVTTNTSVFGSSLLPVDLDNDGDGDLAYTSSGPFSSPKVFRVYRNDGTGTLTLNNSETNSLEKVLSSAFDYTGDGNVDLISRSTNAEIYIANSGINYSLASPTTFTSDQALTFSGDLDGDGDLDIFNANSYNGSNWNTLPLKFFLNDGSAAFSTTTTSLVLPGINVTDLSDYDGDGDLDHIYLKPNGEIGVLLNGNGAAQCPAGDLVFTTQSEIDAFPVSYPNCTQISGNVTISGAGISNLNGLSAITSIDGYLDISYNPDLTNMVGLDALSTIGGYLQVYSNAGLVRFTGLGALTDIGDFLYVGANPDLSDFIGLEALTTIGGYLSIQDNALLGSVTGLEALTSIGAELFFEANPGLTNFNGLNALTAIGGELEILGNAGLTSLSGLEALTSIGSYLSIESNTALTGLTGLENINPATIAELYLLNSGELSLCNVPSICDYLAIPTNPATITGNATGCATRQEIEAACNPLPFCTSLTYPTSISTNIPVTAVLSWLVSAGATGYKLNVGTTFGGTEILNNFDVGNVTTYDPPGDFPYGTIIYVRITPYNGAGEVEECGLEQFTTVPNQSPPSCTGLTIPAPASTNVSIATNLSWSAVANATGYRLTIGTSPGGTEILNNLDVGDVTTYNPSIDFNYNTAIYITIVPYNNVGNAMGCAEQSFTTQQQSACGTLSGLTATIQSSSSVLVSWNPLSGVNAYQLRYRIVGTTNFTTIAATAATSQLINGLSPNTTYEYQLRVKCNGVWSGYNNLNQFTTPETSPVPACTALTMPANNAINVAISTNLSWAASAGATGYLLTIGSTPGGTDLLNNFNTGNVTTYNPPVDFNFNTTIYVTIVPYNGTGNATGCTEQSFTTQQQSNCGTIAGLVAAIQSPTSVLISWNSMAGVNAYQLRYRITGTPTFTTLAATAATSQLITGLMSDTNYEYQLRVKCNGVWSGYNTLSNFITPEGSVIPACTSLINPVNGAANVMISSNISWAASAGATGYLLTIGTTPGGQEILNNADVGNTTTYNPAIDFNYNATIYVKVVPYSGAGNATGCTTQSFTTQQQSDCGTIGGMSAVIQSPTSVLISWNALAGVSAYQLRYRVVGTTTFTTLGGTVATSQLITGLISETNYEYQLRIKCNGVWSAYSGLSNFTTPEIVVIPACTSLTNPVNSAVNVVAGTNLTWSPSSGATGYLLTIGTTPGGNDLLNNLNVGNTTTYDPVTDFNFNTTFYVKVVPFNSAGNATGCVEQNFTTQHQSDCGTINGLSVTVESPTSVLISWNPMAGVSRYQLRYRQVGTTTFISPTATAATSLQITGLSPGNTYEYQLQVRCNGVWSGFNGLSSFTTTTNCTWYADFDNDGLGSEANGTITGTCSQPANYVSNNLDCDDNTNSVICSLPAGNTVSNITSTAATISWTSSPCVTYYQVNYRISGGAWSTPTSVVYGNSITYTGLTPGTSYQYRIRSKCDATSSTSAYVTGGFTTLTPPTGLIEDLNGDVAVSGSSMADFDIYPNPGYGIFYLRLDSESEQGSLIHLTDMMGRLVLSMEWPLYKGENILELDLTDYAKGIYQVHIQKGETTGCKKIVLIE